LIKADHLLIVYRRISSPDHRLSTQPGTGHVAELFPFFQSKTNVQTIDWFKPIFYSLWFKRVKTVKNMDKRLYVTHRDRLSEERVWGCLWGYGPWNSKILENLGKYKSSRKDTEVVWRVVSDHGRDVKFTRRSLL